jgi:hypothetical protein
VGLPAQDHRRLRTVVPARRLPARHRRPRHHGLDPGPSRLDHARLRARGVHCPADHVRADRSARDRHHARRGQRAATCHHRLVPPPAPADVARAVNLAWPVLGCRRAPVHDQRRDRPVCRRPRLAIGARRLGDAVSGGAARHPESLRHRRRRRRPPAASDSNRHRRQRRRPGGGSRDIRRHPRLGAGAVRAHGGALRAS